MSAARPALVVVAALALAGPVRAAGQPASSTPVLKTTHFAFYSDLRTNAHDALIDASGARRAHQPELFRAGGPEQACFDRLPATERDGWTSAVEAYGSRRVTGSQRVLIRLHLAGLLPPQSVRTAADASFLDDATRSLVAATPAYQQCRWATQDALNRAWVKALQPLLREHERSLGRELPMLFRTPWVGLPFRVDLVNTAPPTGANTASPDGDATAHILVSTTNDANQGRAALEVVFHEASHALSRDDSPLAAALNRAARDSGASMPPGLVHGVHFFMTGEAVRRELARRRDTYTPDLFRLKLFSDRFREVVGRVWPDYMDGKRSLDESARGLVTGLDGAQP